MDSVLRDMLFLFVYLDDILVVIASAEDNLTHLRQLFDQVGEHGLIINLAKCDFGQASITFLGHPVTPRGFLRMLRIMLWGLCVSSGWVDPSSCWPFSGGSSVTTRGNTAPSTESSWVFSSPPVISISCWSLRSHGLVDSSVCYLPSLSTTLTFSTWLTKTIVTNCLSWAVTGSVLLRLNYAAMVVYQTVDSEVQAYGAAHGRCGV